MKQVTAVMFAIVTVLASPAWAQKASSDHSAHSSTKASRSVPLAEGEIRKIDKAGKKITLKHGPIPNIDMPAMTMVFAVKDPALLDKAKTGQMVKFQAEMIGGTATVTELEPVK